MVSRRQNVEICSNKSVLRIAMLDVARCLGRDKTIGSIAPGKIADLVIIDGDPLADIDDLGRTVTTMRAGVVYSAAELYASIGIAPLRPR
jgi:imidazolonepropionase-like amidohydrolase